MVENRASRRGNLMPAPLAAKRLAVGDVMILCADDATFWASNSVWITIGKQPFQTCFVIGVLLLHILKCKLDHWRLDLFVFACHCAVPVVSTELSIFYHNTYLMSRDNHPTKLRGAYYAASTAIVTTIYRDISTFF